MGGAPAIASEQQLQPQLQQQQQQQEEEENVPPPAAQAPASLPVSQAAGRLLGSWQAAAAAGGGEWPWWLAGADLPLALLQHPAVQLQGHGPRLLEAWLAPEGQADAGRAPRRADPGAGRGGPLQEQRWGVGGSQGAGGAGPAGPLPPEQRALARLKAGAALDALGALTEAALQLLHAEVAQALGGSQDGGKPGAVGRQAAASTPPGGSGGSVARRGSSGGGGVQPAQRSRGQRRGWLASCVRHAMTAGATGGSKHTTPEQQQPPPQQQQQPPLVARLRALVDAVQACRQVVDAFAAQLP
jgi:hypothetical protein